MLSARRLVHITDYLTSKLEIKTIGRYCSLDIFFASLFKEVIKREKKKISKNPCVGP